MRRIKGTAAAICTLALSVLLIAPAGAHAGAPSLLTRIPEDRTASGVGAAELENPRAVAADPDTGRIYVTDRRNARVSEYDAWGLFVKAWGWGVADGSPEPQTCGPVEPEGKPDPSLCRAGIVGDGAGQFGLLAGGIAVDDEGNVWVGDLENRRIQKFSPAGDFLLMLGGDVNKTKVTAGAPQAERDVCLAGPDVCGAGTAGSGPSQLTIGHQDFIAYNPALDAIVVGGADRIQIFNLNGTFREQINFEGALAAFDGRTVEGLDVGAAGDIYLTVQGLPDVYKLSSGGVPLAPGKPGESSFEVTSPAAVAVDVNGRVYAVERVALAASHVVGFDASGELTDGMAPADEFAREGANDLVGLSSNMCGGSAGPNLYVTHFVDGSHSYVSLFGPPPAGCGPPPERPPEILDQFATSAGTDRATVKARINPRYWNDTTYYVEYGTGKCTEGGCTLTQPIPPGALLTTQVVNAPIDTAGVLLGGLLPGTTYHFRFVADSGGGEPVYGIDPDGKDGPQLPSPTEGLEETFTTFVAPRDPDACPNDALRSGPGANLPDCRAYELVSPLDKGNTDVGLLRERRFTELNQAAPSGNRFTFSSIAAFGDPEGGSYISQYLAGRDPATGWGTEIISPERTTPPLDGEIALTNEFKAFTEDLCQAWLRHNSASRLTPDAVLEYPNIYRRDNCAEPPTYEAITTEEPPTVPADKYSNLQLKGFSDDGSHTIYVADDKLHPDAPEVGAGELLLYERTAGQTRFVCYLPGETPTGPCAAGTNGIIGPDFSILDNAISADGSHIFWTATAGSSGLAKAGPLYVRIDGTETVAISDTVELGARAFFWTASEDGSKAIFEIASGTLAGNLYEFDVATETPRLIAEDVEGPMGFSEDAARIYFASTQDLDDTGPAGAGEHNLYLYEAGEGGGPGSFTFIGELATQDIGGIGSIKLEGPPTPIQRQPAGRWATVSEDGRFAAFMSSASLTEQENRDAASGEPSAEVFRYDAEGGDLRCVSCSPTGARPTAANMGTSADLRLAASRLPGWTMNFHSPHVLSTDGQRIFFESIQALVPRDTNGAWDVYQWEAPGKGSCSVDDATFDADAGGCVELISSGRSPADSEFLDADPSGNSAFIATQASLLGIDYGLNDVYAARIGGGFPEPEQPAECEGEACQSPPPPPPATTPGSFSHHGPPNPKAKPRPRRCPKGKRRVRRAGKVKCVAKKRKASKGSKGRKASKSGRAAR
ncbi:MAG TPA: NHL repeat-containing protein [Solirubrobacterales bacterium]|nr:NHL repeat-containing protein [Solirubrobacterales bacterium]